MKKLVHGKRQIIFYEGYRGRQEPRAVVLGGHSLAVREILERKRVKDNDTGETTELFLCRLENGQAIKITVKAVDDWDLEFLR